MFAQLLARAVLINGLAFLISSTSGAVEYNFTAIDAPAGSSQMTTSGINNLGQIVGSYLDSSGKGHVFLYTAGQLEDIDFPGRPSGMNDLGQIVGWRVGNIGPTPVQFGVLRLPDGTVNDLPILARTNFANGINNFGRIVGYYQNPPTSPGIGFLYSDGVFTKIVAPNSEGTQLYGINNAGQIAGTSYPLAEGRPHGFLYSNGTFSTIEAPGAVITYARGINDAGDIVGYFRMPDGSDHGYLFKSGSFSQVDVVDASRTLILGNNDSGQIVGIYMDAAGQHGFLGNPAPTFAGKRGEADCEGKSVSALARQYGGLPAAAAALKLPGVQALRQAIEQYCGS